MSASLDGKLGAVFVASNRGATQMVIALLLVCILEIPSESARAQDTGWDCLLRDSTPEANANNLHGITFALDRFLAVGDSGTVMVSTNASEWFRQPTPTQSSLYSVAAGEGQFVAIGDAGCVLRSTNGYDWALATSGLTNNLRAIAFGNGVFVVLDDQYRLRVSSDASIWQLSGNSVPPFLTGLYFGGGLFVAYGLNGVIMTSTNGLNWAGGNVGAATFFTCGAYGGGVFVAAGHEDFMTMPHQVARSTDGRTWNTETFDAPNGLWSGLCYGGGRFVGIDDGQIVCSTDGISWGTYGQGSTLSRIVAYGLGQYLALADGGVIFTATDPSVWTRRSPQVCPIQSLAQGNGVYAGTGNGTIYSSEDGVHFIERLVCGGFLTSVIFTNGLFVTSGSVGILRSTDGTNWTTVSPPCSDAISAMQYADGMWMAVCGNMIISSVDGTNWVTISAPCPNPITTMRYADGMWVAGCGSIISSVDGTNWTVQIANAGWLSYLIYGRNRWVGCGWNGLIWSSPDGTNWQNCSYATVASLGPIVFQDGLYSIYSTMTYMVPTTALVSRDGLHWFDASRAGPLLAIHKGGLPNTLILSLAGTWGSTYGLQRSLDLDRWSEIQQITNSTGVCSSAITNLTVNGPVFFRAVSK